MSVFKYCGTISRRPKNRQDDVQGSVARRKRRRFLTLVFTCRTRRARRSPVVSWFSLCFGGARDPPPRPAIVNLRNVLMGTSPAAAARRLKIIFPIIIIGILRYTPVCAPRTSAMVLYFTIVFIQKHYTCDVTCTGLYTYVWIYSRLYMGNTSFAWETDDVRPRAFIIHSTRPVPRVN